VASGKTEKALSAFLKPEFINRVDEIITFRSLDTEDFSKIAKIMLGELREVLLEKGMELVCTDEPVRCVAEKSYSHKYGARNMRRFIQREIEDKLAEIIISNYTVSYKIASVFVSDDVIKVECK
jgi:ATP-dependent Clp protease ATP-binding subunit ClpA